MPFFIAAVAFLFAATFLYPGDAMIQVGGGHFWTVLWLLLLLVGLLRYARRFDGTKPAFVNEKTSTGENAAKPGRKEKLDGTNAKRERRKSGQRKSRKNVGENAAKTERTDRAESVPPFRWGAADLLLALFLLIYLVLSPLGAEIEAARNAPPGFSGGGNFFVTSNIFSAWVAAACAWFLFRHILTDRRTAGLFLVILLALGLTEFFTALWQNHVVLPRQVAVYWADPAAALRQAGLDFTPDSTEGQLLASRLETAAPTGSYILANTLGGQLVTAGIAALLPLLFLLFSVRKPDVASEDSSENPSESSPQNSVKDSGKNSARNSFRRFSPRPVLLAATVLFATILYALYLIRCRGAFVALAVALVIFLVNVFVRQERRRFRRFGITVSCLVLLGTGFALSPPGQTLLQGAKRSLGFRFEYWTSTAEMVAEHPWTGCGIGNFQQAYLRYKKPVASEEILDPHNFVMELAGCGGLFSVGLFLLFLGAVFWRSWKFRPPESASFPAKPLLSPGEEALVYWTALGGCLAVTLLSRAEGGDLPIESLAAAPAAFLGVWFLCKFSRTFFSSHQESTGDTVSTSLFAALPTACFVAPAAALLVHLLAAGGISYVNVLVLLMFLAAAMLTVSETTSRTAPPGTPLSPDFPRELSRVGTICLGSLCAVLLLGVLVGLYLPGIRSRTALDAASSPLTNSAERLRLLEYGAQRQLFLSHGYERALLDTRFQAWIERPDRRNRELLETEIERIAARAGRSPLLLLSLAAALERVDTIAPDPKRRETVLRYYARACELYPNHAKVRAPYALALWKYGCKDEALRQRDEALRLDDIMPHLEQRLPSTLRGELENLSESEEPPSATPGRGSYSRSAF